MPRIGYIETSRIAGKDVLTFSASGLAELQRLAQIGTPPEELAQYFQVPHDWLVQQMKLNDVVREVFEIGDTTGRSEIRMSLHAAAVAGDVKAAAFLAERRLKMDKTVSHEHKHTVNVIGTMPDHKLESENWLDKFGPASRPKAIEAQFVEVAEGVDGGHDERDTADGIRGEAEG